MLRCNRVELGLLVWLQKKDEGEVRRCARTRGRSRRAHGLREGLHSPEKEESGGGDRAAPASYFSSLAARFEEEAKGKDGGGGGVYMVGEREQIPQVLRRFGTNLESEISGVIFVREVEDDADVSMTSVIYFYCFLLIFHFINIF